MGPSSQHSSEQITTLAKHWAQGKTELYEASGSSLPDTERCKILTRLLEPDCSTVIADSRQLRDVGEYFALRAHADSLSESDTWVELIALTTTLADNCQVACSQSIESTQTNDINAQVLLKQLSKSVAETLQDRNPDNSATAKSRHSVAIRSNDRAANHPDNQASNAEHCDVTGHRRWMHDLRSPLQAALLTTELVLMEDPEESHVIDIRQELEDIRSSIMRSIDLIQPSDE